MISMSFLKFCYLLYFGNFLNESHLKKASEARSLLHEVGFVRLRCRSYLVKGSFRSNGVT